MILIRTSLLAFCLSSTIALADYGWIPEYKKLNLKVGADYLTTASNFLPDATLGALSSASVSSQINEFHLWTESEYGLAQDWSVLLSFGYISSSLEAQDGSGSLATGSGISDVYTGVKWNFKSDYPLLTLEAMVRIPTSPNTVSAQNQLVIGDGNFDVGLILHAGTRAGSFLFDLSPGILGRFGGYSSAFTAEGAAQFNFPYGYVRAVASYIYSFQDVQPFDSSPSQHDAPGSGGSYLKLNGSPIGMVAGGKIGVRPLRNFRVEAEIAHSVFGEKFPNYLSFGLNLMVTFDFFSPERATKVKEVPFEGEQPNAFPDQ